MMSVVMLALEKTKSKNLCLAGGVALIQKLMAKLLPPAPSKTFLCSRQLLMMALLSARRCALP